MAQQYYPPANFQGIAISSSEIGLSWFNLSEYKQIEIRKDTTESVFLFGSAEGYTWGGLSPNTEYSFEIQAQYADNSWSGYSDPIYITTYGETLPPQDLEIEVRGAYVELNWTAISLEADETQIFRSDGDHTYDETPLATTWPNVEYFRDETPLSHCWYKLRTKQGINYSDWSEEVECLNYGAPEAVINLAVSKLRPTWSVLTWGVSPTSAPVEKYRIEQWNGTQWIFFCDVPEPYRIKKIIGLEPDTNYKFRIRAENSVGVSSYVEITFTTEERDTLFFESKTKEKEIVYVATIFTEPEIIVSSGEYPEAFANLYIETDEINYSAVSRLLSQGLETTAGQIVISATKGITEDDLKSTFFDAGLISKEILIEVYFPETATSFPIVKGLISKIEYREHKIYLSYDDIFSSKKQNIALEKLGKKAIPIAFGTATVEGIISSLPKRQIKLVSHRLDTVFAVAKNDEPIAEANYRVDNRRGILTLHSSIALGEEDKITASIIGNIKNTIPEIFHYLFSPYIDEEKISVLFGVDTFGISANVSEEISSAEFVARLICLRNYAIWQSSGGIAIDHFSKSRSPEFFFLKKEEIIDYQESIDKADKIKKAIARYSTTLDIPEENKIEKVFYDDGEEREFELFGSAGDASYFLDTILPDWTELTRVSFSIPFFIPDLEPAKVIELQGGERILVEKVEVNFSKQKTRIEGIKI